MTDGCELNRNVDINFYKEFWMIFFQQYLNSMGLHLIKNKALHWVILGQPSCSQSRSVDNRIIHCIMQTICFIVCLVVDSADIAHCSHCANIQTKMKKLKSAVKRQSWNMGVDIFFISTRQMSMKGESMWNRLKWPEYTKGTDHWMPVVNLLKQLHTAIPSCYHVTYHLQLHRS